MRRLLLPWALLAALVGCGDPPTGTDLPPANEFDPAWAVSLDLGSVRVVDLDPLLTPAENGERLRTEVAALEPGVSLFVGPGEWVLSRSLAVEGRGTPERPIAVRARPGFRPLLRLTSPGSGPVVTVGRGSAVSHVLVRGFEITGPTTLLQALAGSDLWLDDLVLRDGAFGLRLAEWTGMERVHVTRCRFLDAATETVSLHVAGRLIDSVIAANHLEGESAGIEIAGIGSAGNRLAANEILGTRRFALRISGGLADDPRNVVERNLIVGGSEEAMVLLQSPAVVRNNLVINDSPWASYAYDLTGSRPGTRVVHNTFVANHTAVRIGRPGEDLVFANNACYARDALGLSMSFSGGETWDVRGNVVFGTEDVSTSGYRLGNGLGDFADLTWDGSSRDAHPAPDGALVGAGVIEHHLDRDLEGYPRGNAVVAGAYRLP